MTSTDLTVLLPTLRKFWDSLKSQATYWLNGITTLKMELFWERHILSFLPVTEVPDFRPIGFNEVKLEMYDQVWGYPIRLLIPDKLCRLIIELAMQNLKGSVPTLASTNTAPLRSMTMFHFKITLPKTRSERKVSL